MAKIKTLIEESGLMNYKEAAARLGVTEQFFKVEVSPNCGHRIGRYKLFSENDLRGWLVDKAKLHNDKHNDQNLTYTENS